jgi:hypothetical protein
MYNGKVDVSRMSRLHVLLYCRTCFEKTLKESGISLECVASIYITIVPNSISLTPKPLITDKQNYFIREIIHTRNELWKITNARGIRHIRKRFHSFYQNA